MKKHEQLCFRITNDLHKAIANELKAQEKKLPKGLKITRSSLLAALLEKALGMTSSNPVRVRADIAQIKKKEYERGKNDALECLEAKLSEKYKKGLRDGRELVERNIRAAMTRNNNV